MHQSQEIPEATDIYSYRRYLQPMLVVSLMVLLLGGLGADKAHANFTINESSSPGTCPANHKMYYLGIDAPTSSTNSPVVKQSLIWTSEALTRDFTFNETSGNKIFNLRFEAVDLNNNNGGNPPFFGSIANVSTNAINLVHNSPSAKLNNIAYITVNKPVSKIGFKIQDLDSLSSSGLVSYREQAFAADGGLLTFNSLFHQINSNNDTVTAISGRNCGTGECNIEASWGYKSTNSVVRLAHYNVETNNNSPHAVGYSDFYFCLAPPKVLIKKEINGNRINDTDASRDQFELSINRGTTVVNTITTTGSGSAVTNNDNRNAVSIAENTSYTITERVRNGTTLGEIANYNATYTCTNATTGSTTVMPTANMVFNATAKTRSFTLSNLNYGDEITCTITNTPSVYTFTGFVFNDNGGISSSENTRQDISATFTNNANYFNGIFDSSGNNIESGIGASGLQVRLTNCIGENGGTNITGTTAQNITSISSPLGQYKFTVPASTIAALSPQKVCIVQVEPSNWEYSIDTTSNTREITLVNGLLDYKTESNGSRNLDFGEVKADNTSLVLIKSQYVHSCNINSSYNGTSGMPSQTPVFSIDPINNIEPGKCIAYKIEAYNRGHVDLTNIQITDKLQTTPVKSVFVSPFPLGNPIAVNNNSTALPVDTIISNTFSLVKPPTGATPTKATLYFNTKYGTTTNSQ